MKNIDKTKPVMVTGATGYVAGWLVKKLLEEGFTVHAPVRDPDADYKLKYLNEIVANTSGSIHYFKADLLDEDSYRQAMTGCEVVFHTASPFKLDVKNAQKDLVDPARLGTQNILNTVNSTESVKRVVLTSSCAAVYGDSADLSKTENGVFTEEHWNKTSTLKHQPYSYSKTVAEQAAWAIHDKQSRWDLVTVNPALVVGPGINPHGTSESFNLVKQVGDGTMKSGVPHMGFGVVDVRDVAEAHYQAAFTPAAKGRYMVFGHNTTMLEMAGTLLQKYGVHYPIPKQELPKWLVWLVVPLMNKAMTRKVISLNVGLPWKGDNSKGKKELGLTYRPLQESMNDFFEQMLENGLIRKRG